MQPPGSADSSYHEHEQLDATYPIGIPEEPFYGLCHTLKQSLRLVAASATFESSSYGNDNLQLVGMRIEDGFRCSQSSFLQFPTLC